MKKNRIFGALSAAALLLAGACSNDMINSGSQNEDNVVNNEDGVFLAVHFDLPSAKETRSYTTEDGSNSGTEVGHDYENTVKSAYIVLAKTDNTFIAAGKCEDPEAVGTTGISYRSTSMFTKTELNIFYQNALDSEDKDAQTGKYKVNVFVFANPTDGLSDYLSHLSFGDTWVNGIGVYNEVETGNEGIIWNKDYFLMSNSEISTRLLPASIDDWNAHTTAATAFNLSGMNNFGRPNEIDNLTFGNVKVERAAARYDFRDGALDGIDNTDPSYNGCAPQTYHVVLSSDNDPLVDVFLGKMSMVNMNKEYYFLRRVSPKGLGNIPGSTDNVNNVTILGKELPWYSNDLGQTIGTPGNYVVDAYWDWKATTPTTGFSAHFNYPFFTEEGIADNPEVATDRWYTSVIKDVLENGVADNPDSWNSDGSKKSYKTWRYLTEGTIPEVETQQYGITNGIVFKGLMQPARDARLTATGTPGEDDYKPADDEFTQKLLEALKTSEDGNKLHDPILYEFGGHLYCTWEHIRRMAIYLSLTDLKWNADQNRWDFSINRSTLIYNAVFGTGGFGSVTFDCDINGELKNADFLKTTGPNVQTLTDDIEQDKNSANFKYNAWKEAFKDSDDQVDENEAAELVYFNAFRDAAVGKNIKFFQTSYDPQLGGWGYYCYYYYWNRHNDNGDEGAMGPMEFDVVRNNVYKLAVTKIARLGHPRISANDPDKPTPNTPDEKGDVYITVTCTTLPWVVRENEIHF